MSPSSSKHSLQAEPPDPSTARSDLPEAFLWAAGRALAKQPAARPGTGAA